MDLTNQTIEYYDSNSNQYISNTLGLDMESLYTPFLENLPIGSKILDAGCGPGRDTKNFILKGYKLTAFDASKEMVENATEYSGIKVHQKKFQDIKYINKFDGIWACASLLHVPFSEMKNVISSLSRALKVNGIFYLSFKYGDKEVFRNGRHFSNFNEKTFTDFISDFPEFTITKMWKTGDLREGREDEQWLNVILQKKIQLSV